MVVSRFAIVAVLLLSSSSTVWPAPAASIHQRPELASGKWAHYTIRWPAIQEKQKEFRLAGVRRTNQAWLAPRLRNWSPAQRSTFRLEPALFGTDLASQPASKLRLAPAEEIRLVEKPGRPWSQTWKQTWRETM